MTWNPLAWAGDGTKKEQHQHALSPRSSIHAAFTVAAKCVAVMAATFFGSKNPSLVAAVLVVLGVSLLVLSILEPPYYGSAEAKRLVDVEHTARIKSLVMQTGKKRQELAEKVKVTEGVEGTVASASKLTIDMRALMKNGGGGGVTIGSQLHDWMVMNEARQALCGRDVEILQIETEITENAGGTEVQRECARVRPVTKKSAEVAQYFAPYLPFPMVDNEEYEAEYEYRMIEMTADLEKVGFGEDEIAQMQERVRNRGMFRADGVWVPQASVSSAGGADMVVGTQGTLASAEQLAAEAEQLADSDGRFRIDGAWTDIYGFDEANRTLCGQDVEILTVADNVFRIRPALGDADKAAEAKLKAQIAELHAAIGVWIPMDSISRPHAGAGISAEIAELDQAIESESKSAKRRFDKKLLRSRPNRLRCAADIALAWTYLCTFVASATQNGGSDLMLRVLPTFVVLFIVAGYWLPSALDRQSARSNQVHPAAEPEAKAEPEAELGP